MSADTHLAGSFAPSHATHGAPHHGGAGGSPTSANRTMSVVQHEDRMDQIMKIDTQALLKTIQDLEKRLSDHQRQDNLPPWAQALQTRMEQIEKMRGSGVEPDAPKPIASEVVNLSTLTMEERIISKIRSEFETKIGNSQLHFEGIISSYSLEMERLHKLLMIRPTTSELQQVVLNVQQQEHRTQQHLQEMQNVIMANVRDRISEEMIGCLLELKNARAAGEEGSRLIAKQIADFTAQMGELREGAQNSIVALQEAQAESKILMESQKSDIEQSRRLLKDEIYKVNAITLNLKNELKSTSDALGEQAARFDDALSKMDDRMKQENQKVLKELQETRAKLEAIEQAQVEAETTLAQVKYNFEKEMEELREWRKSLDQKFLESDKRQFNTEKQVAELIGQNFGTQIKKAYDQADKLRSDLDQLTELCQQTLAQDIKSNSLKISLLQEQCNIAIPKTLSDHALRMTDLYENLRSTSETIEILRGRHDQADELIASLMPLKEKVAFLQDAKTAQDTELNNLKDALTSCIDANSEFARRMEEFEESIESFDESINSRMNRIRDTLLDTLLDKHGEATVAVRNARDNLEVMSMAAGEAGMSVMSGSDAGAGPVGAGGKGRPTMGPPGVAAPRMTVVHREADNGAAMQQQAVGVGNIGQLKRIQSYRVPTMQGQVIQGSSVEPPAGGSQASTASSQHAPAPLLGNAPNANMLRRQSSARMQHQTQNILNQHRKIVGMSAHTEGNATAETDTDNASMMAVAPANNVGMNSAASNSSGPGGGSSNSSVGGGGAAVGDGNTGRSTMSGNTVHIALPHITEGPAPPSPDGHHGNAGPEGEHPAIELSPVNKHQQQGAEFASFDDNGSVAQGYAHQQPVYHQQATYMSHQQQHQPPQAHNNSNNNNSAPRASFDQYAAPVVPAAVPTAARSDVISQEYTQLLNPHGAMPEANVEHEAQFLADLCLNFEDISLKRKKVSSLPLAFCQSIASITKAMAELIAEQADFEMVEQSIAAVNGPLVIQDVTYDEMFVVNTRQKKQDEYINLVLRYVNGQVSNGGVIRSDARQLFIALVRKALEMFMTKHNQVLVAGNSRLGKVKIPSCIACDRPLVEKARLDRAIASPPPGTRGLLEQSAATLRSGWSHQQGNGNNNGFTDEDPASSQVFPAAHLENSLASSSGGPGKGILGRGLLTASMDSQRPKTMTGSRGNSNSSNSNNNPKILKSSTLRPNSSAVM